MKSAVIAAVVAAVVAAAVPVAGDGSSLVFAYTGDSEEQWPIWVARVGA